MIGEAFAAVRPEGLVGRGAAGAGEQAMDGTAPAEAKAGRDSA